MRWFRIGRGDIFEIFQRYLILVWWNHLELAVIGIFARNNRENNDGGPQGISQYFHLNRWEL